MAKKTLSSSLIHPTRQALPAPEDEATYAETDQFTREQAGREIDARFREALRRGDTRGDVVFLDEQGNEIKNALSSKTIFDSLRVPYPGACSVPSGCHTPELAPYPCLSGSSGRLSGHIRAAACRRNLSDTPQLAAGEFSLRAAALLWKETAA